MNLINDKYDNDKSFSIPSENIDDVILSLLLFLLNIFDNNNNFSADK